MDIHARLEALKAKLKRAEQAKTVAETQLQAALARITEIEAEMQRYDVSPETIRQKVKQLEEEITDNLAQVEGLIPQL